MPRGKATATFEISTDKEITLGLSQIITHINKGRNKGSPNPCNPQRRVACCSMRIVTSVFVNSEKMFIYYYFHFEFSSLSFAFQCFEVAAASWRVHVSPKWPGVPKFLDFAP